MEKKNTMVYLLCALLRPWGRIVDGVYTICFLLSNADLLLSLPAEPGEVRTQCYPGKLPCRQTAHWDFVSTTTQPSASPVWSNGATLHDRVNKAESQAWWAKEVVFFHVIFSCDSNATSPLCKWKCLKVLIFVLIMHVYSVCVYVCL